MKWIAIILALCTAALLFACSDPVSPDWAYGNFTSVHYGATVEINNLQRYSDGYYFEFVYKGTPELRGVIDPINIGNSFSFTFSDVRNKYTFSFVGWQTQDNIIGSGTFAYFDETTNKEVINKQDMVFTRY